ncbi:MAG: hypothetical protein K2N57_04030 [Clostridia bacterium]|nr:hypothetical protein [Clostridia bacterium]
MQEEFEIMPNEEQIAMMNKEFSEKGVGTQKSASHLFEYPIPVYTIDVCSKFCGFASAAVKIISTLDTVFVSRNKKAIDFIATSITKNRIAVASIANLTQEFAANVTRMPIKQSMYKLLELHNSMSVILGELCVYVKSVQMQEIVQRHTLAGCVLHGLCI